MDEIAWRQEWIPVGKAVEELKVHPSKLSKMIKNKLLETRNDPLDERKVLVQRQAVYELFRKSPQQN